MGGAERAEGAIWKRSVRAAQAKTRAGGRVNGAHNRQWDPSLS